MLTPSELAIRHLALRLRPLTRVLQSAVDHQAALAGKLLRPDVTPLCVTDEQVTQLLVEIEQGTQSPAVDDGWELTRAEASEEQELQSAAGRLGVGLPLDQLRDRLGLTEHET